MLFLKLFKNLQRGVFHVEYALLLCFVLVFMYATDMVPSVLGLSEKHTTNSNINMDAYRGSEKKEYNKNQGNSEQKEEKKEENDHQGTISDGGNTLTPGEEETYIVHEGSVVGGHWHEKLGLDNRSWCYALKYKIKLEADSTYKISLKNITAYDDNISVNNNAQYSLYSFTYELLFEGTDIVVTNSAGKTVSAKTTTGNVKNTIVTKDSGKEGLEINELDQLTIKTGTAATQYLYLNMYTKKSSGNGKADIDIKALEKLLVNKLAIEKI